MQHPDPRPTPLRPLDYRSPHPGVPDKSKHDRKASIAAATFFLGLISFPAFVALAFFFVLPSAILALSSALAAIYGLMRWIYVRAIAPE